WDVFAPAEARIDAGEIREEIARLDAIAAAAAVAPKRKRERLIDLLGEPTLIFTAAIATARDLHTAIQDSGIVTSRGMHPIDALDGFRRGRIDTLICTDLASEGLNL